MLIYCCECGRDVQARLTDGKEIYPHRVDLASLPFWKCDICKNYVGCHHKTKNRIQPLGNIPNQDIREARQHLHSIIDPIWKSGTMNRGFLYGLISEAFGRVFHTGEIRSVEEADRVLEIVNSIRLGG